MMFFWRRGPCKWRLRHSGEPIVAEAGKPLQLGYEQIPADQFLMKRPHFVTDDHVAAD